MDTGKKEMAGRWTKERPAQSGFYWYRDPYLGTQIIDWDVELPCGWRAGSDLMIADDGLHPIDGEFWSERLVPPGGET